MYRCSLSQTISSRTTPCGKMNIASHWREYSITLVTAKRIKHSVRKVIPRQWRRLHCSADRTYSVQILSNQTGLSDTIPLLTLAIFSCQEAPDRRLLKSQNLKHTLVARQELVQRVVKTQWHRLVVSRGGSRR